MQVREPNNSGGPVVIVADSATDPPEELVQELGIFLVPIYIRFGEEVLRDRVDITVEQVMARLSRGELAKTANPGPADFLHAFRQALEQVPGATILCFCISARLSGGYQSALVAKQMLGYPHIHVVDTRGGSLASGWVVIEAARAARRGEPPERILEMGDSLMQQMRFYAALDDLRHLYHTGRLGRAQAALGTLLDIKPILTIREGEVALVERVRSRSRAMQRLVSLASEGLEGKPVKCAVFYTGDEEPAEWLARELAERMRMEELIRTHAGPVITAAVGPGLVGFALFSTQGKENGDRSR
ncbi:MAG: DegV family protein [Armatimonadota bacterium]|nr:DegV family protein [Armatimonadota bacterium]MDR5703503.1 DegV family protein [Armatimonadota bacterium]